MRNWDSDPRDDYEIDGNYRRNRRPRRNKRSGAEQFFVGLIISLGFGAAFYFFDIWWLIFPLVFAGILPMISGLRRIFQQRNEKAKIPKGKDAVLAAEKMVLDAAFQYKGKLSVLQAAKATSLSIDEARDTLESMAKKGYAGMRVDSQGVILYEFPEFLPPGESSERI